jgi:hypothetical protein
VIVRGGEKGSSSLSSQHGDLIPWRICAISFVIWPPISRGLSHVDCQMFRYSITKWRPWGPHHTYCKVYCFLNYDAVLFVISLHRFRRNIRPALWIFLSWRQKLWCPPSKQNYDITYIQIYKILMIIIILIKVNYLFIYLLIHLFTCCCSPQWPDYEPKDDWKTQETDACAETEVKQNTEMLAFR